MSDFDKWYTENGYYHDTVSESKELMREAWNAATATKRESVSQEMKDAYQRIGKWNEDKTQVYSESQFMMEYGHSFFRDLVSGL